MSNTKIIGFAGIECYDLMVCLGKTINRLGCSCILVDNSDDLSLACVYQDELSEGEIMAIGMMQIARNLHLAENELEQYNYVLVYFGFNSQEFAACDEIYCVSDFQQHNIRRIAKFDLGEVCRFLVVREGVCSNLSAAFLVESLPNLRISQNSVFEIAESDEDLVAKIMMHHSVKLHFAKASSGIRDFVVQVLNVDFADREIRKAFKLASKG